MWVLQALVLDTERMEETQSAGRSVHFFYYLRHLNGISIGTVRWYFW